MIKNFLSVSWKTYVFKQWTRKCFAVFNSLKLVIKIGVVNVAFSLLTSPDELMAQADTSSIQHGPLDEVVVSSNRAPITYSQMARIVSVITQKEIEQAPCLSADELLERTSQVDLRQRGANGMQSDISIQGGSFDQTLVLLNGFNLSDPQTGHQNLNLPVDLESIDRIEIIKGPASRIYGANAFCGAVNFLTGSSHKNYIKAHVAGGEYGLNKESLTLNINQDKFSNFLAISRMTSDGYVHNTDYLYKNLFYQSTFQDKDKKALLNIGYTSKSFGANSFYSPKFPDQYEETETMFIGLKGEMGTFLKLSPSIYWRRNYDFFTYNRYDTTNILSNYHFTDLYGGGLNATYNSFIGKTSLGIEFREEKVYSTLLGKIISDSIRITGKNIYYNKGDQRLNLSTFIEHQVTVNQFSFSGGCLLNHNTMNGNWMEFYPGVDASFQFLKNIKLYGTVNKSLRLPTYTELYYRGAVNQGNIELKPEKCITFETGIKFDNPYIQSIWSFFYRQGTQIIDWTKYPSQTIWQTRNITNLETNGMDISLTWNPLKLVRWLPVNYINISYSYLSSEKQNDTLQSLYTLDYLKHCIKFSAEHNIYKKIGASWQISWNDRNGTYKEFSSNTFVDYTPYWLINSRIYYKMERIMIYTEVANLTNEKIMDVSNVQQPGRWIKAGIKVNLNLDSFISLKQ